MHEELWTEVHDTVQEAGIKIILKKKKYRKGNGRLCEEALQVAEKRRESEDRGGKETYTRLNADFPRIIRGDKKALLSDKCREIEENNRMGKTRDLVKKIRSREHFVRRWAQ